MLINTNFRHVNTNQMYKKWEYHKQSPTFTYTRPSSLLKKIERGWIFWKWSRTRLLSFFVLKKYAFHASHLSIVYIKVASLVTQFLLAKQHLSPVILSHSHTTTKIAMIKHFQHCFTTLEWPKTEQNPNVSFIHLN